MSMPVGWFPDPADPEREMLWDGEQWTGLTRPRRDSPTDGEAPGFVDPGTRDDESERRPRRLRRRTVVIAVILAGMVVLVGGGTATAFAVHAKQVQAEAQAERNRAAERRAKAQERAEEAQRAADDAERTSRSETVTEVEASVKKLAEEDAAKDLIDGPILSVSCNPVSGSTDDLTDTTTTFDCFAANTDNADGTQSGYFFNATVNWNSGEYTYGLGKSGA